MERPPCAKDGWKHKQRMKVILGKTADIVESVKEGNPTAKDIVKAASNLSSNIKVYNQGYRVVMASSKVALKEEERQYELMRPYLQSFEKGES